MVAAAKKKRSRRSRPRRGGKRHHPAASGAATHRPGAATPNVPALVAGADPGTTMDGASLALAMTALKEQRRATYRGLDYHADYRGGREGKHRRRLTGVQPRGSHADYHVRSEPEFFRLTERAREFDRNDSVLGQGITRFIDNVVQDGIRPDPQTGDKDLDAKLAALWADWSCDPTRCDVSGEMAFNEYERLVLRHVVVDGDVLAIPRKDGALELIEAHRLRTPRGVEVPEGHALVHGVHLGRRRRRVAYWVTREQLDAHGQFGSERAFRLPALNKRGLRAAMHLLRPKRVSQTRGVSVFVPIVDLLGMLDDVQHAKLLQQQIVSAIGLIRERMAGAPEVGTAGIPGAQQQVALGDGTTKTEVDLEPGWELTGAPGETIKGFSPNVPNPEFFDQVMSILKMIAANLGMPVAMLLLDPSETNFSGWRGAMDQARIGFRQWQNWLVQRFHRPVWRWKVMHWLAADESLRKLHAQQGVDAFKVRMHLPTWAYIEPSKDVKADKDQVDCGLISPSRKSAERGRDWNEVAVENVRDRALQVRAAVVEANQLNSDNPEAGVGWRELVPASALNPAPAAGGSASEAPGAVGGAGGSGSGDEVDDETGETAARPAAGGARR